MSQPQADGLFARTGLDAVKIGGHKVPIALIGGVAALATVLVVLRARKAGQNVASVGATPATYTAAGTGFGSFSPDYTGALANLSQQLTSLGQAGINGAATVPATPPLGIFVVPRPPGYGTDVAGQPGSGIPVYRDPNSAALVGEIGWNAPLQVRAGSLQAGRALPGRGNEWEFVTGPTGLSGWAFVGDTTAR